jgi:hypothetical protein
MFSKDRLWSREEVGRLPTPEPVDYKELKSYRARLIPSRMIDHRLSRIERLVLDAYVDMTTIDYVRKEDGKRIGLVNGPYGGTSKEGMAPATTAKDIVEYWLRKGATISLKSVQAANRKLLALGHIVRRRTGPGWIIGIAHSVKWWNDPSGEHISYRFKYWNDLFQQMDEKGD